MLKKFTPIIQDAPTVFAEDVYLLADSGKMLCGRHQDMPIKDVFALIDTDEFAFIRENMFFSGLKPLLLVDSQIGPIFIDNSLFGSYRTFVAIIPHFSRGETLSLVKGKLKSIVYPSDRMKKELELCVDIAFDDSHEEFAERLLTTHRGAYYYRVHGRTNGEISMMMSEIAYDFSRFCGCELEINISGVGLFEMKNDLCIDSYLFALSSLLFLARNYSLRSRARMDVFFDELGIYFEFGFELSREFQGKVLSKEALELKNFSFRASSHLFECEYYQNERVFAVRCYPWFKHPNSADIKEKKREFIYNL